MKSIQTKISIVIAVTMLLATGTLMLTAMLRNRSVLNSDSDELVLMAADYYAAELDDSFKSSEQSVGSIYNYAQTREDVYNGFTIDTVQRTRFTKDISELSKSIAQNTRGAMAVYLRYDPDDFGPTEGFWYNINMESGEWDAAEPTDISMYDKDDVEHVGWYYTPINAGKPVWMDPYYNKNIGVEMISYIIPYFKGDDAIGVIGMDINLEILREEVSKISIYKNGRAFLMSKDGNVIYHKDHEDGISFEDLSDAEKEHFKEVLAMPRDSVNWHKCLDGEPAKIILKELRNGMIFGITVPRRVIAIPQIRLVFQLFVTSLSILIISVIVGILWVRSIIKPLRKMTDVADRYAEGDYSERMSLDSNDELGRLSRSLDTMSTSLMQQIEKADAANRAKSAFLSNMSHEIRTPINAVLGLNEMVLRESDDKNILVYSNNIKTAGNTLLSLINDILDFSKIEAGKVEIVPVDYDLSSVINDLINMVRTRTEEKGLELELDFDRDIPKMLNGDEVRIKQIITNILTNAVKYTDQGKVTFRIGYEKEDGKEDAIRLKVSVADTGRGIKKEDLDKLFSEFERIDEKKNRNIEGTGLGMAITKNLLEMMGSSLEVESTYGEGSVFSFSISQKVVKWVPLGDYEASFTASVQERGKYSSSFTAADARVLMIDDNPTNLLVFKSLIKQTLVKTDTVLSGDEGLSLCGDRKYDIIFIDHMMPGKDGIETLKELKAMTDSPNADTPVICLTANAISGAREEYIKEGFDDYLSKPIDPDKLEEMIIEYLPANKVFKPSGDVVLEFEAVSDDYGNDVHGRAGVLAGQDLIDVETGIMHCGGEEVYLDILRSYYEDIDDTIAQLDSYLENGDTRSYSIRVHSLKSTSRTIGAEELGEKAKELEDAGKNGDIEFIRKNHDAFIELFMRVRNIIAASAEELWKIQV